MRTAMLTLLVFLWMAPSATAQLPLPGGEPPPEPQPYGANDPGGFRDILPPGTNGLANPFQLVAFQATGQRPPHNNDQLALYGDLIYKVPGLSRADLNRHFKDATFGVKPEDVERRYSPRSDVTIVRDRQFGVPHVYGRTRGGTMFGLGYITAEDRLFFIDVLRHLGRARLSSFVGGAEGNRELDREQWQIAPYTEADLERQLEQAPALYGDLGRLLREDLREYTAGINQYIREARIDPTKLPGEYFAISQPQGPEEWRDADAVAIASLVGGIFGKGGGGEMQNALDLERFEQRFGPRIGKRHFDYFRQADDPEAPRHVWNKRFPYLTVPKNPRGIALPDRGSVRRHQISNDTRGGGGQARAKRAAPGILGRRGGLQGAFPGSGSNALVVSGAESQSGRPLAVFGPQTGYFSPQILMEQDVHGPGIDARGAAFPGVNLYVELGRGRDFAWSATSAGNDIVDTFAVPLCEPGGARPTLESQHYEFRGRCEPFEVLERRNAWTPNAADQSPPGSETLRALRTRIGLVAYRATVDGRPVAYTRLRTTYGHEVDSAVGFAKLNDPDAIRGPRDFQRAVSDIGYTFNWLYADSEQVAYFNSGNNPVRHPRHHPDFPVSAKLEWRGFDPDRNLARYTAFSQHPQLIDQRYISSWNGKQALGYRAADSRWNFSAVDRVQTLDKRIDAGLKGANKLDLVELTEAMEDGGTVDLRGQEVLPWALRVIEATRAPAGQAGSRRGARRGGTRRPPALTGKVTAAGSGARLAPVPEMRDPRFRAAILTLKQWVRRGAHRRDRDRSGTYEDAEAVALMDAWWPGLARATFDRKLGGPLYSTVRDHIGLGDMPHSHLGSAFDDGIWGHVQKDLRRSLGRRVRLWPRSSYCGSGRFETCRRDLARSLAAIVPVDPKRIYRGDSRCANGDQVCWDEIRFTPLGGITQPPIHWVNRPTYQQVVEVQGRAPR